MSEISHWVGQLLGVCKCFSGAIILISLPKKRWWWWQQSQLWIKACDDKKIWGCSFFQQGLDKVMTCCKNPSQHGNHIIWWWVDEYGFARCMIPSNESPFLIPFHPPSLAVFSFWPTNLSTNFQFSPFQN